MLTRVSKEIEIEYEKHLMVILNSKEKNPHKKIEQSYI